MGRNWFTSDLHFGHKKLALLRGLNSVEENDNTLLDSINTFVKPMDTLYILGDVSFYKPAETAAILSEMNGVKVLVKGNHDHRTRNIEGARLPQVVDEEYHEFHHYLEREFQRPNGEHHQIVMFHFPLAFWRNQDKGWWHLHGHLHGNPSGIQGKVLDVGWDAWGRPLELEEIAALMEDRPVRGNHHTEVH